MRVLLLSRYGSQGASSRVRYLQYRPWLKARGVELEPSPLFSNAYVEALYAGRPRLHHVVSGYWRRLLALLRVRRFDCVILEKELFPFLPATVERLFRRLGVPFLVDYDDAVFHRYELHPNPLVRAALRRKIDVVMRSATAVVAGNAYLAARARQAGARETVLVPTVVDTDCYRPAASWSAADRPVIGWIGSPATAHYLRELDAVFTDLARQRSARWVAVGASDAALQGSAFQARPWRQDTEVQAVQQFDIGIMPLPDAPWERGKCGYKLIQYMACGKPVVASPVGVNRDIVQHGVNGYLAASDRDWRHHLDTLLASPALRARLGAAGRERAERAFSLQAQAPRLLACLRGLVGGRR